MKTFNITVGKGRGALKLDAETLIGTRCLIQGKSGSGKSHLVRVIVEQTIGHGLQTIVFDPSGEFKTLREKCDLLIAGNQAEGADVPLEIRSAKQLLRRVAETGISCVLDLSDLSKKDRREFVRIALDTLHNLPRKHWGPRIIVVDECQEYAPESGKGKSTALESVIETANQGRKRGHCLIAVTLRLSALSKDVTAELQNKFIGCTDHIDLKRAQDALGSTVQQREELRKLPPGTYYATGPALNTTDLVLFDGRASQTTHPKPGTRQRLKTPPPSRSVKSRILKEFEALPPSAAQEEADNLASAQKRIRELERELRLSRNMSVSENTSHQRDLEQLRKRLESEHAAALTAAAARIQDLEGSLAEGRRIFLALEKQLLSLKSDLHDHSSQPERPSPSLVSHATRRIRRTTSTRNTPNPDLAPKDFSWDSAPGKLLTVLVQYHPEKLSRSRAASLAGLHHGKSTFRNALTKLRQAGVIEDMGSNLAATDTAARAYAPFLPELPSGDQLIDGWKARLGGAPLAIFQALLDADGTASRFEISTMTGIAMNSTFRNALTKLRNLGLLKKGTGDLHLADHVVEAMS